MHLLRTIRFDTTDDRVFDRAARDGELAVSGALEFADLDRAALIGKVRQAFANGFLGLPSLGRSTFAIVCDCSGTERDGLVESLAQHFIDSYGAPDLAAARAAAEDEVAFVGELCREVPINTLFTVRRTLDESDAIAEEFRTISAPSDQPLHARIWAIEEDRGDG